MCQKQGVALRHQIPYRNPGPEDLKLVRDATALVSRRAVAYLESGAYDPEGGGRKGSNLRLTSKSAAIY